MSEKRRLAVSRAIALSGFGTSVILEKPEDAVYFGKGDLVRFGVLDNGERMREGASEVKAVDRVHGVVEFTEPNHNTYVGDFVFTDPPGMQLDSPWEALRQAKKRELAWVRRVWDALKSRGER